ncbi:MAG TPA: antitoxin [Gammaproteobacteria bacterium]|nr:antitoxin [Gammaproteobacteria bacterium]
MLHLITVTEAVRSFADIIGRVYYKGDEYNIKKGNQIVAHIGPSKNRSTLSISELNSFFASCPTLLPGDAQDFEQDIGLVRSAGGEIKDIWD